MKLNIQIRRPVMTRAAWAQAWSNWLALSVLTVTLVLVTPVPTPQVFLAAETAIVAGFVLSTIWLTVIVRVLPPEPRDSGPSRPGALQMARQWAEHMSGRLAAVKARLTALGALGSKGRA